MAISGVILWEPKTQDDATGELNRIAPGAGCRCISFPQGTLAVPETGILAGKCYDGEAFFVQFDGYLLNHGALASEAGLEGQAGAAHILAALFRRDGAAFVHKLEGSYIIAVLDKKAGKLLLVRDRRAMKWVYYAKTPGAIAWSSRLDTLLDASWVSRRVDPLGLAECWHIEFSIPPNTCWADIHQLPNGQDMSVGRDSIETRWYYKPPFEDKSLTDPEEAKKLLRELTLQITEENATQAGSSFGSLLSGGIDSNIILTALAMLGKKPEKVFTFKPDHPDDESPLACISAKHFDVPIEIIEYNPRDLLSHIRQIIDIWGEPYLHSSVTGMIALMPQIAGQFSHLFTGDGGGEAFYGSKYPYAQMFQRNISPKEAWLRPLARAGRAIIPGLYPNFGIGSSLMRRMDYVTEGVLNDDMAELWVKTKTITTSETRAVFGTPWGKTLSKEPVIDVLRKIEQQIPRGATSDDSFFMRIAAFTWNSEAIIPKTNRPCGFHGMTTYSPFVDHRLGDAVNRIPMVTRVKGKKLLLDAFLDVLPDYVEGAKPMGMMTANRDILASIMEDVRRFILTPSGTEFEQVFNVKQIGRILDHHESGRISRTALIISLLVFRAWFDKHSPSFSAAIGSE